MMDCPYKGLIPYSEADAEFFFGRDDDIKSIINNLKTRRLTTLYGESGVGKSSVLRAGVTHQLRQETARNLKACGLPKFTAVVFPPDALIADNEKVSSQTGNNSWQDEPLAVLREQIELEIKRVIPSTQSPKESLSFIETLKFWTEGTDEQIGCGELLIILDQFEQYFLYHPQDEEELEFDIEFCRAIKCTNLSVNFLISIREDELAKLDRFQDYLPNLSNSYLRIEHLDRQSSHDAITKPIDQYNKKVSRKESIYLDPDLVEAILDSVAQYIPSANGLAGVKKLKLLSQIEAPYLQLVMQRLWKEMEIANSRCLVLDTLMQFAEDTAKNNHEKLWTAVKQIVRDHLNTAMAPLSEIERDVAASIFRYLVTPSGAKYAYSISDLYKSYIEELEDNDDVYDPSKYNNILENLLEALSKGENRIFRPIAQLPGQLPSAKRYEIFHDVLTRPILTWRRRYLEAKRLDDMKNRRVLSIKRSLATQSLRQQRHRRDRLASILARQAYLFDQRDQLHVLERVDDALRQALSAQYFRTTLKRYSNAFLSVAFSPDGTKLAAASLDGTIHVWHRQQNWFEVVQGHETGVVAIAFSCDGKLASGGYDNTIKLWDLHSDMPISASSCKVIAEQQKGLTCIAFSPDGRLLASGGKDQTVKLWDLHQPTLTPIVLEGHPAKGKMGSICSLAFNSVQPFSPVQPLLAAGCDDRTIWLWDVQEPAQTPTKEPLIRYGHEEMIRSVAFSPCQELLASASDDRTIRLWDLTQRQATPRVLQAHTERVRVVTFSPDGKILASASDDQTIRLWDTHHFERPPHILRGHTFDIQSVAFSPDSQFLASGSWDHTLRFWDLRQPVAQPKILTRHKEIVRSIAISSMQGAVDLLASGSDDRTICLYKLNQPEAKPITLKCSGRVLGVALFMSDNLQTQLLAVGSDDSLVYLWDLRQPLDTLPKIFAGHQKGVSSVAFSSDGHWLVSGSWDTTIKLWNLNQPKTDPIVFKRHASSVTSVAFSPDGQMLASASDDKTVLLWSIEHPDSDPTVLKGHNGRVWATTFSPDGQLLASASDDRKVRLWNLRNLDPDHPVSLTGHSAWVSSVAFSPDSKTLASGSFDRSIRLWQIDQMEWKAGEIKDAPIVLENHSQSVTSVAFTSDGKHLVSGSYDHTTRLWIASTDMLAEMVCEKVFRNLTPEEWKDFISLDIDYESTCPTLPSDTNSKARSESRPFFEQLSHLSFRQKRIFAFIQHRQQAYGKDTSWDEAASYLRWPKTDLTILNDLEVLHQLGFLQVSTPGTEQGTRRFRLSQTYIEDCGITLSSKDF